MPSLKIPKLCLECGGLVLLKAVRDIERKKFCSRSCKSRYLGRNSSHLEKMIAAASTPEANAKKGRKGEENKKWLPVGTKRVHVSGYVKVKDESGMWKYDHRLIASAGTGDVVHHKDHCKSNNSPSNLEVMSNSLHAKHHANIRKGLA